MSAVPAADAVRAGRGGHGRPGGGHGLGGAGVAGGAGGGHGRAGRVLWPYVYVAPFVVLVAVFTLYPIIASLVYTLYRWNGIGSPDRFVGLGNFREVVHDDVFWRSFGHSLQYTAVLVPVQLLLALVLAVVLNNPRLKFSTFYRSVYFIPVVMSPAIIGVVFQLMLANFGDRFGHLLAAVGLPGEGVDWLADPSTVMWVVIGIGIWNTLGYNLVYFLAGLQAVPAELYEAAAIDGAGPLAKFWHVTLPGLREVGLVILFLAILGSLQVFDLVQVLTGGGPYYASSVVNTYIYQHAFGGGLTAGGAGAVTEPNVGFASAASFFYGLILMVITGAQALVMVRVRRRNRPAEAGGER